MYTHNTDAATVDAREGPATIVPAIGFAEADYAMAHAKNLFKRLTGYPAVDRHDREHDAKWGRKAGTSADHGVAYAKDLYNRLRVNPADDLHDHGHRLAGFGRMARTEADHAVAYAKDLFKRLKSFPPTAGSSVERSFPAANALGRAMARLSRLIRESVVEPFSSMRRRKIAIAQLESLDDRLLTDIGLARGDILPKVDGMLARRDDTARSVSRPVKRPLPAEERRHELPLAA
jgi:uncharacterized protein YjiS (DUF1127 family)